MHVSVEAGKYPPPVGMQVSTRPRLVCTLMGTTANQMGTFSNRKYCITKLDNNSFINIDLA